MCVCVCVCVCERARLRERGKEREREGEKGERERGGGGLLKLGSTNNNFTKVLPPRPSFSHTAHVQTRVRKRVIVVGLERGW